MAGKETRGAARPTRDLFRGRTWVLTPDEPAELETPAAREFRGWLERIGARAGGARCRRARPRGGAHFASAATGVHRAGVAWPAMSGELEVSGSGLVDMTRLAASSYDLWRDILATNSGHIERALADYIQKLEHMRENLRTRQLQQEFERGAALAGRLRRTVDGWPHSVRQIRINYA